MNSLAPFCGKVKKDSPTRFFWQYWKHVWEATGKYERWDLFFLVKKLYGEIQCFQTILEESNGLLYVLSRSPKKIKTNIYKS